MKFDSRCYTIVSILLANKRKDHFRESKSEPVRNCLVYRQNISRRKKFHQHKTHDRPWKLIDVTRRSPNDENVRVRFRTWQCGTVATEMAFSLVEQHPDAVTRTLLSLLARPTSRNVRHAMRACDGGRRSDNDRTKHGHNNSPSVRGHGSRGEQNGGGAGTQLAHCSPPTASHS